MTEKTEKMININKWKLNDNYLVTYTATWCNPCQRIKPVLLEKMKNNEHLGTNVVERTKRPEHVKFIPWFDIVDKDGNIINSIQTSKEKELLDFLQPTVQLNDDF
jgi:thiol-disulfide isomerase/thioredoxin